VANPDLELSPDPRPRRGGPRRTAAQWFVLTCNLVIGVGCLLASGLIWYGNKEWSSVGRVELASPSDVGPGEDVATMDPAQTIPSDDAPPPEPTDAAPGTTAPSTTNPAPRFDTSARNYLLTGTDNNACVDPSSPYAGAFGDRFGDRSDAIIVLRVDPRSSQAAILSFPRDLWVRIDGRGKGKINQAIGKGNVQRLVNTIFKEFGVPIDHYINVDFCAFKHIVDDVGGVSVPFEFPARDKNTGLNVPEAGCHSMLGDESLAYVRSRHYFYLPTGAKKYREDPSSDLGRVTRQQDFIKRVLQQAIEKGAKNPTIAAGILNAVVADDGVTIDDDLTAKQLLDVAQSMRDFDPTKVRTFQIESKSAFVGNSAVQLPLITSDAMKAVLAVFKGEARMADAVEQPVTQLAPTVTLDPGAIGATPTQSTSTSSTAAATPVTAGAEPSVGETQGTQPEVVVSENPKGIFPPPNVSC
jgi:LCP family protein required for cell wall assembly